MSGFLFGRIRGIEVRANWSVLIVGLLIAWSLADAVLPEYADGHSEVTYWVVGIVLAVAFLAALVAHEIGHSIVALRHDVQVDGITLWMFGGVAMLGRQPSSPKAALQIAIAGPLVSLGLGVLGIAAAAPTGGLLGAALGWFGTMNLVLALFNVLPAFPLDGGRIYQAWQWQRTGDQLEATERATSLGLIVGAGLVATGVIQIAFGSLVGGVWMMMIGWFLRDAARSEFRTAQLDRPLDRMPVREVMTPAPTTVGAATLVEDFMVDLFFGGRHAAYPVVDGAGVLVGLVSINDVRPLSSDERMTTTVASLARPLDEVPTASSEDSVRELLEKMNRNRDGRALVIDDGTLVGIVSPSDLTRLITLLEIVGAPEPHGAAGSPA